MRAIEPTKAGRYKVRFRHGVSPKTGLPKQASETFDTKKEAQTFARWLKALGAQGALDQLYAEEQTSDVPGLDRLAADHVEHLTGIEDGTRESYTRLWGRTWSPLIGHLPANQVGPDDIRKAVNSLGEHYSHKSLENQRGLLSGVLGRAVEKGHLPTNPAKGIKLPRGQEGDADEMRILTPAEFADLIALTPEHFRPFIRFLAGTGCRWGEAVALQVKDVQLPNIRVRRALKWHPSAPRKVGATKTRKSNRTVAVGRVLQDDLRAACAGKGPNDLVWTAIRGGQILHRTFWERVWLPAAGALGPRPRIHDLRHTHASTLLAAGVPIHIVQRRLGHESIQTTVDTYGHLLPDAQVAAASAAELAFGRPHELGIQDGSAGLGTADQDN